MYFKLSPDSPNLWLHDELIHETVYFWIYLLHHNSLVNKLGLLIDISKDNYFQESFERFVGAMFQVLFNLKTCSTYSITNYVKIPVFHFFFFFEKVNKGHLKLVSAIFYQFLFYQMIVVQKLWKMLFISPKKLFSFSRYSHFLHSPSPLFFTLSHCFRGWFKKNLKIYDVISV